MPSLTQTPRDDSFILSVANRNRSYENVTIEAGQDLVAGTVLGLIDDGSLKYVAYDLTGTDGSDTAAAILRHAINTSSTGLNADASAAVLIRDAEVQSEQLTWPAGRGVANEDATGKAVLEALGIRFR